MSNFYSEPPQDSNSWISKLRDYMNGTTRWDNSGHVTSWTWKEGNTCYTQKGLVRGDGRVLSFDPYVQISCDLLKDGSHQGKMNPNTMKLQGYSWDGNYWRGPGTR